MCLEISKRDFLLNTAIPRYWDFDTDTELWYLVPRYRYRYSVPLQTLPSIQDEYQLGSLLVDT